MNGAAHLQVNSGVRRGHLLPKFLHFINLQNPPVIVYTKICISKVTDDDQ